MRLPGASRRLPAVLLGVLLAGLAGAQVVLGQLQLAGQTVQSIRLYGAEYISETVAGRLLGVSRDGAVVRVTGFGHTLLLPLDEDQQRATTDFNTVQLDTERVRARSATLVNGNLYLPLDTLARGLGATYQDGKFVLAAPRLLGVSSRAGRDTDRLVLDLTRDVEVRDEARPSGVVLTLRGLQGEPRRYTTRGAFVKTASVARAGDGGGLTLSVPLPPGSGYRVYKVVRGTGVRVVLDAGPGVPVSAPAVLSRLTRPLIVLDPARVAGGGRDVTLDVARRAAELLTSRGWQVRLTREQGSALGRDEALKLARQSDVFLALDLGRFPGAKRGGVTVYEQTGTAAAQVIDALRTGTAQPPYGNLVVAGSGSTRRLAELLRGELRSGGITAGREGISRVLSLGEAPQAALLLELGWVGNAQDQANLGVDSRLQAMAGAVARSVATYLTVRANNAGAAAGSGS